MNKISVIRQGKREYMISGATVDKLARAVRKLKPISMRRNGPNSVIVVLPEYTMATAPAGLGWSRLTTKMLVDFVRRV